MPVGPRTTVLDALLAIRRRKDPGLTVRHSCLHGSCGTCGMRVNGREVLACVTRLQGLGDPVVVEPLAGARVVGDLVVDMEPLYRRLEPVGRPLLRASERAGPDRAEAAAAPGAGPVLEELERFEDCIECGLCLSACPVAGDSRFLGPAALAAAERVLEEPRGTDGRAVLGLVDDAHGAWRCHRRSSARRSARPGSTRAGRSCACAGGCSPTGCQGWSASTTRRCRHDAGGPAPGGQAAAVPRWLDPHGRHLGTWAFVANRLTGLGLVVYLYLHLVILSTLLRGPEAWDGLVELFRRPVFLAFDVLLVAGLAFHGFNGLRVALVGSGLLVDRHKALLVAAGILVGLVTLVAAVRIVG